MKEEWLPIKGYEGLYEISNLGVIRSLDRTAQRKDRWGGDTSVSVKGRVLRPIKMKNGYLSVSLSKDGYAKIFLIHRLVASAFIPNEDTKMTVNHKNENKADNRAENLEWMTLPENLRYGTGNMRGHTNRDRKWHREHNAGLNPNAKKVIQLSKDGEFIKEWDCIKTASKVLGICMSSICAVAKGKTHTAGNYKWQYK